VFLSDGRELPTLHFHDGGSTGLLHALQRYVFLNRYTLYMGMYIRVREDKGREEGRWREKEREEGRERAGVGRETISWVYTEGTCKLVHKCFMLYEVESLHKLCEFT
jgi:hypothetical protein